MVEARQNEIPQVGPGPSPKGASSGVKCGTRARCCVWVRGIAQQENKSLSYNDLILLVIRTQKRGAWVVQ